jgi:predicted ATP-grasp superfamily ATP-dependent carboligase
LFGEEFGIGVVCDGNGNLIDSMALKKLVMCERGKTWAATSVPLAQAVADLAEMFRKVAWAGPADVEFIRDSVTERLELIEINPRFPGWIGFSGMAGSNLPRQLLLAAMERPPVPAGRNTGPIQGAIFMRTVEEIPAAASTMAAFVNRGEIAYD